MQNSDYKSLPGIRDIVKDCLHLRNERIILRRMEGASLSDLSFEEGMTRSEIRQLEKKALERLFEHTESVSEDEYKYVYENYSVDSEFYKSLPDGECIYYYLKNRYDEGYNTYGEKIDDELLSETIINQLNTFYGFSVTASCQISDTYSASETADSGQSSVTSNDSGQSLVTYSASASEMDYISETASYSSTYSETNYSSHSLSSPELSSDSEPDYVCDELPPYVTSEIDELWSIFQSSGVTEPLKIAEQASLFFFLKYLDDEESTYAADNMYFSGGKGYLYFDETKQDARWSYFHNLDSIEQFRIITEVALPFIKNELRFDSDISYLRFIRHVKLNVNDPFIMSRITTSIDTLTGSHVIDTYTIFSALVSKALRNDHFITLATKLLKLDFKTTIVDPISSLDNDLSLIASSFKKDNEEALSLVWNKMHFSQDMYNAYGTSHSVLLINALKMLFLGVKGTGIEQKDILTEDLDHTFTCVTTKIPAKITVNTERVSASIKDIVTSNNPSLMYMYACHVLLKPGGIAILNVPHKSLIETSVSHIRLRGIYLNNCTVIGIINLKRFNRDILIYKNEPSHSLHKIWFTSVESLSADTISAIADEYSNIESLSDNSRSDNSFLVPLWDIDKSKLNLGYETYREYNETSVSASVNAEPYQDIMRRVYRYQSEIDATIETIKKQLEKL